MTENFDDIVLIPLEDEEESENNTESKPKGKGELHENSTAPQQVMLVSVDTGEPDFEQSLEELRELTATAGGEVVAVMTQKLSSPIAATCVGSGRLEEIRDFCKNNEVDLIIFDLELTPIQLRNIEHETGVRVIDRTMLILDIFAQRAISGEGKLQVELAQLKYMLPRLTGKGIEMSRLGGGIGTRGPGETKLETDRRHIHRRIDAVKEKLAEVEKRRSLHRARRRKTGVVTAAIVGYTNAGKSTLLNRLTNAGVLAENKLFATLDPTSRALTLPSGGSVTLVDTVGFIRRLPHHLIEAFKSTLEEALDADIIILLCDGSDPDFRSQLEVSRKLLDKLGAAEKPTVTVINKCDAADHAELLGMAGVRISALNGDGLDKLLAAIEEAMPVQQVRMELLLPFSDMSWSAQIRSGGEVLDEEYTADGLRLTVLVDPILAGRLKDFELNKTE